VNDQRNGDVYRLNAVTLAQLEQLDGSTEEPRGNSFLVPLPDDFTGPAQ